VQTKPSIVFAHGIWADGSCFNKVIPPLQADGYEVASAQYGLDTNQGDVAATLRTLGRVSSPVLLVGHSCGGSVITPAGTGRFGMELGYHVTLVKDATAAFSPEAMHAAHVINGPTFAHAIVTTEDLIPQLSS
jgi:hypothetical protein